MEQNIYYHYEWWNKDHNEETMDENKIQKANFKWYTQYITAMLKGHSYLSSSALLKAKHFSWDSFTPFLQVFLADIP